MENRAWLKNYPKGVPANVDTEAYCSINELIEEIFEKFKKKKAFSNFGKAMTYGQIDLQSKAFGAYLLSRGLVKGDRIALMMPNLLQYPIALFGAIRAGLIVVNTNPLYTPREMKHQFVDSGAKAIVIAANFAQNLEKIIGDTEIKTVIVTTVGELLPFPKGNLINFVIKYVKKGVPKYDLQNIVNFREALSQGKKFSLPALDLQPDDTAMIQYTGGTTGVSKGAMLTHKNLIANCKQVEAFMSPFVKEGEEIALSPLPMYHIFAFTVHTLCLFSIGAHSVLVTNPRDLKSLMKEFKANPISLMTGVNTLFNGLVNHPDFNGLDFSSLKITIGGGMAVQRPVAEKWQKITECPLTEGYGMTESSPVLTVNPLDGSGRIGMIGLPVPSTDMRIVGDDGSVLGIGQVGEIQAKGDQVMKGYYNRPEATAETIDAEGWLSTGDIGMMDEEGFFKIVDRKKDMILVSGFNVFPNEVEEVIMGNPKVLEVAAIGIPDEKSGEVVKVFVVKKDASLTSEEVIAFCREEMTGYKIPKVVEFRNDLPKSNVGKILRKELREG